MLRSPLSGPDHTRLDQFQPGEQPFDLGPGTGGDRRGRTRHLIYAVAELLLGELDGVGGPVGEREEAARPGGVAEPRDDRLGVVLVGNEVQHGHHEHGDRLVEIEQGLHPRVGQDRIGVTQVLLDNGGVGVAAQDVLAMGDRDGIDVHIYHFRIRRGLLRHLVDIAEGRDAGAEIQELTDSFVDEEAYGPMQKRSIDLHDQRSVGNQSGHLTRDLPVDGEVMAATEPVVVDARGTGPVDIDAFRRPARPIHPALRCQPPRMILPPIFSSSSDGHITRMNHQRSDHPATFGPSGDNDAYIVPGEHCGRWTYPC